MNVALWFYLLLYNVYLTCSLVSLPYDFIPFKVDHNIISGYLLFATIVIFSLRPFFVKKLNHLVLLLASSLFVSAIVASVDIKTASVYVALPLVIMSLILIPIAFCKRLNRLNEKSWIIMPLAILFFILIYIGKRYFPQWVGSYDFYVALEFGCVIVFIYSLVQNSIYIIRKVLKE